MGLDWLVQGAAKPGCDEAFRRLVRRRIAGEKVDGEALIEVSVHPYVTLGVPCIGAHAKADAYALATFRSDPDPLAAEDATPRTPEEEAALASWAGQFVLPLVAPCEGLAPALYQSAFAEEPVRSFRADVLKSAVDIIGEGLLERAFTPMDTQALLSYGTTLTARSRTVAQAEGWLMAVTDFEPPPTDSAASLAHAVHAAGRWCTWWGSHGHWVDPWF